MSEKQRIHLAVCARNEARAIGGCLTSLLQAVAVAEKQLPLVFDVVVIADDCTDETERIAQSFGRVRVQPSTGGKVEAQRRVANTTPFVVFSDADILVSENALTDVCRVMLENPALQVAYATKQPLAPSRSTLLARALYSYNRLNGFQVRRKYFNARFFAIRDWRVPTVVELEPRLSRLPRDRFYRLQAGILVDDIWLSRDILQRYGPQAIREVDTAQVWYRPPETFEGMHRTYLRMRRDIERLNLIFPETVRVHQKRGYDREAFRAASSGECWLWRVFQAALLLCRIRYRAEKFYYQHLSPRDCVPWKPVEESKQSLDTVRPA
jgi:glycosyltransferase involved in cell wall biosynthesis